MTSRGWGYWTEAKLDILSQYLPALTTASKRAAATVYLDLFAGNEANQRRDTLQDVAGSPVRALQTSPPLTNLYFFELEPVAEALNAHLRSQFPNRAFEVIAGDCHQTVDGVLDSIRRDELDWAPTFAFIDPYGTKDLRWELLTKLAEFKRARRYKVELWLLFFGSAIPRLLGRRDPELAATMTRMFGSSEWEPIAAAREGGALSPEEARYEYTNLMRWRIENVLGYRSTHALDVKNTSGAYLYDLIFATDNAAGDTIMGDVYERALARNERMRQEALEMRREGRTQQPSLFGADVIDLFGKELNIVYVREPPSPPFGTTIDDLD